MANVKATDTVIIREMFKGKETDLNTMASSLKPEIFKTFQTTLSVNWIPLEFESEIIQAAARLLFPKDPRPIFKLGHTVAGKQFTGVYKFFLRIPSVSFIVKNASASFNTMNDKGSARVDDLSSKGGTLVISDLPEMSIVQREYICGVVTCVLELAGAKNIKVEKIENHPVEWKWKITWD
jgi:uncharacterized protein (TIGR02265 family)